MTRSTVRTLLTEYGLGARTFRAIALLLLAGTAGCAKVHTAAAEPERVVHPHVTASHAPAGEASDLGVPGLYVNHQLVGEYGGGLADVAHVAPSARPATLDVKLAPSAAFRAYPVFASQAEVTDLRLSTAVATWGLTAYGQPVVAKVAVKLEDGQGGNAASYEVDPADLGWPRLFSGQQDAAVPLAKLPLLAYLQAHPATSGHLKLELLPEDGAGQPIATQAGAPLDLALDLQIL